MLSVVIPAKNELENIQPLVEEIYAGVATLDNFEIIYVDDGSTDGTFEELLRLKNGDFPAIKVIRHDASVGQSTAIYNGVQAASGELIITLDADGQNNPADIAKMYRHAEKFSAGEHFCIAGYRKHRKDTPWKRLQSRIANKIRGSILHDGTPDTGCGLKIFPKATFQLLPYFDHMHRFIPALIHRLQGTIVVVVVDHRDRQAGISKYTMWNRLWVGIVDMVAVRWLQKRVKHAVIVEKVF